MTGRRLAVIALSLTLTINSFAYSNVTEEQDYLVSEQPQMLDAVAAPPVINTQAASSTSAKRNPSRPGSRFDEIDDYQFGQRHGHHRPGYGDRDCHSASGKIRDAVRGLNSLAFSGQIKFSTWQAQNYYQISMNNLQDAARSLSYGYHGKERARYILTSYIPYLRSLARHGHIQFWDQYGRDTFRRNMRDLSEARRMLEGNPVHHQYRTNRRISMY